MDFQVGQSVEVRDSRRYDGINMIESVGIGRIKRVSTDQGGVVYVDTPSMPHIDVLGQSWLEWDEARKIWVNPNLLKRVDQKSGYEK